LRSLNVLEFPIHFTPDSTNFLLPKNQRSFAIGKPKVLYLPIAIGIRNSYFIIGTALPRARSASGIRNAPSEAGGRSLK